MAGRNSQPRAAKRDKEPGVPPPRNWRAWALAGLLVALGLLTGPGFAQYHTGTGNATDLSANPLVEWRFNEAAGTATTADSSGWGGTGSLTGFTGTPWVAGQLGNALDFDGTNDRVTLAYQSRFAITGSTGLTFAFWINPDVAKTTSVLMIGDGSSSAWGVLYSAGGDLRFDTAGTNNANAPSVAIPTGEWTHAVMTWDGSHKAVYLNGNVTAQIAAAGTLTLPTAGQNFQVGYHTTIDSYFDGQLDELKVYNRTLNPSEVYAMYASEAGLGNPGAGGGGDSGRQGDEASLANQEAMWDSVNGTWDSVNSTWDDRAYNNHYNRLPDTLAHWTFNDAPAGTAINSVGTIDGTLNGDPTPATNGSYAHGYYFDGAGDYITAFGTTDHLTVTSNISLETWVRLAEDGTNTFDSQPLLSTKHVRLYVRGTVNQVTVRTDDSVSARESSINLGTGDRNLHHIIGTYEHLGAAGQRLTIYVDGVQRNQNTYAFTPTVAYNDQIGRFSTNDFHGVQDEVRIHNRTLNAQDVAFLYAYGTPRDAWLANEAQHDATRESVLGAWDAVNTTQSELRDARDLLWGELNQTEGALATDLRAARDLLWGEHNETLAAVTTARDLLWAEHNATQTILQSDIEPKLDTLRALASSLWAEHNETLGHVDAFWAAYNASSAGHHQALLGFWTDYNATEAANHADVLAELAALAADHADLSNDHAGTQATLLEAWARLNDTALQETLLEVWASVNQTNLAEDAARQSTLLAVWNTLNATAKQAALLEFWTDYNATEAANLASVLAGQSGIHDHVAAFEARLNDTLASLHAQPTVTVTATVTTGAVQNTINDTRSWDAHVAAGYVLDGNGSRLATSWTLDAPHDLPVLERRGILRVSVHYQRDQGSTEANATYAVHVDASELAGCRFTYDRQGMSGLTSGTLGQGMVVLLQCPLPAGMVDGAHTFTIHEVAGTTFEGSTVYAVASFVEKVSVPSSIVVGQGSIVDGVVTALSHKLPGLDGQETLALALFLALMILFMILRMLFPAAAALIGTLITFLPNAPWTFAASVLLVLVALWLHYIANGWSLSPSSDDQQDA